MSNWKGFERFVSKALGVERYSKSHLGESAPDIVKSMGNFDVVIDCKNRKVLNVEGGILKLEAYKTNSSDIMAICYRKTGKHNIDVYMKMFYLLRLLKEAKEKDLQFADLVVRLDWKDFLDMVKKIESKSKRRNTKKE